MDREELVESSSSQNVNLFIADLRNRGTRKETVSVSLSEGSSFFIPSAWAERFGEGVQLGERDLEEIRKADEYIRCREWAAAFLASREESSGRLLQKMIKRGYSRDTGREVIQELQQLGFQDDARFAEQWLRGRMESHPESRQYLEARLLQRGVSSCIASESVSQMVGQEEELLMLRRLIEKWIPDPSEADEKQIRRIMNRGFSYSYIKRNLFNDNEY